MKRKWIAGLACTLAIAAAALPAKANDVRIVVPQLSPGQLQNLQNRQQRLDFQQRQQLNRELDSLATQQRQPRPQVPIMRPSCRPQQFGISC